MEKQQILQRFTTAVLAVLALVVCALILPQNAWATLQHENATDESVAATSALPSMETLFNAPLSMQCLQSFSKQTDSTAVVSFSSTTFSNAENASSCLSVSPKADDSDAEVINIADCEVSLKNELTYNAQVLSPSFIVIDPFDNELSLRSDYTRTYYADEDCTDEITSNDIKNAGIYYAKLVGTEDYERENTYIGEIVVSFEVAKAKPKLTIGYSLTREGSQKFSDNVTNGVTATTLEYGQAWTSATLSNYFYWTCARADSETATYDVSVDSDAVEVSYEVSSQGVAISVTPNTLDKFTVTLTAIFEDNPNYESGVFSQDIIFEVGSASLSSAEITVMPDEFIFNEQVQIPETTVTLSGVELIENTDYELVYYTDSACKNEISAEDIKDAGTYYIKAQGMSEYYSGKTSAVASFSIGRATPTLVADPDEVEFNIDENDEPAKVAIVYVGDGEITVSSSNEKIATAIYADGMVEITPVSGGEATVTVFAAAGANYEEAAPVEISVSVIGAELQPMFAVNVTSVTGGTIKASKNEAYEGDEVSLTADPLDGFELVDISVTDSENNEIELTSVSVDDDISWSFTMPPSDVTVKAQFSFKTDEPEPDDPNDPDSSDDPDGTENPSGTNNPGTTSSPNNSGNSGTSGGNEEGFTFNANGTGITVSADISTAITNADGYIGCELVITPLAAGDTSYDVLADVSTGILTNAYDITLYVNRQAQGEDFGTLTLTFPVGKEYEGRTVLLWNLHANEDPAYYIRIVEDGVITVRVSRLSAFAVDVQPEDSASGMQMVIYGSGSGGDADTSSFSQEDNSSGSSVAAEEPVIMYTTTTSSSIIPPSTTDSAYPSNNSRTGTTNGGGTAATTGDPAENNHETTPAAFNNLLSSSGLFDAGSNASIDGMAADNSDESAADSGEPSSAIFIAIVSLICVAGLGAALFYTMKKRRKPTIRLEEQ